MVSFYIYISLLFIMIILMLEGLSLSRFAPIKIRLITIGIILAMIIRYFTLIILALAYNIRYLYLLKPFFFTNFFAIPILALTVLYIFLRKDNISFSYIFIFAILLLGLYVVAIYISTCSVQIAGMNGYTMSLYKNLYIYWAYIGLNTIVLFLSIMLIMKGTARGVGMTLIIISSLAAIIELILWFLGIKVLQENIIGDMLWSVTLVYALIRVSKKNFATSNKR